MYANQLGGGDLEEIKKRAAMLDTAEKAGGVHEYIKEMQEEYKSERTFSDAKSLALTGFGGGHKEDH